MFTYGYVKSRQKAKNLIENNNVKLNGKLISKPSFDIDENLTHNVEIFDNCPYVSRGGLKLEAILDYQEIDIKNKICLDIGASTGGFTDCLIKRGAKLVYAIDSGTNQLDKSLKNNKNVVSIENFNARNLSNDIIKQKIDIITIDVSFISQTLIMEQAFSLLKDDGVYISLIKPQFEVGKSNIGKGGIVKNASFRELAINKVITFANEKDYLCNTIIKSPILGGDGNTEYLAVFSKNGNVITKDMIKKIINSWWGQNEI